MSVKVVNVNPTAGGTLISVPGVPGAVEATGTFDETATLNATLQYGTSTWVSNQENMLFAVVPPNLTVQWAATFGPPGGAPVPGGLKNCKLTVSGTNANGTGSSVIMVNTPRAAFAPDGFDDAEAKEKAYHDGLVEEEEVVKVAGKAPKK
jgi:hypothetical protein